eukprot:CAMPEP_0174694976 /NCGR_PEP_ID=MMETSP1094-20130205/1445_1 /TAXON_ID=156173 /ORGANISM="Chrysochromulina brevifilum, Strain UTEX LB 985" /LENGTH=172 /DNA_ID=CAMNT_0015891351 /DNA_START=266 /DNA_END=785 /DNA_ORIENTATION=-
MWSTLDVPAAAAGRTACKAHRCRGGPIKLLVVREAPRALVSSLTVAAALLGGAAETGVRQQLRDALHIKAVLGWVCGFHACREVGSTLAAKSVRLRLKRRVSHDCEGEGHVAQGGVGCLGRSIHCREEPRLAVPIAKGSIALEVFPRHLVEDLVGGVAWQDHVKVSVPPTQS